MKFDEYYKKTMPYNRLDIKQKELLDTLNSSASCILPEEIERAFLSVRGSLWFFSKGYALCVDDWSQEGQRGRSVHSEYSLDMYLMPLNIQWLNIKSSNYDFQKHTDSSKLSVTVKFKGEPLGQQLGQQHSMKTLVAHGANCDDLKEIVIKYLMPKKVIE